MQKTLHPWSAYVPLDHLHVYLQQAVLGDLYKQNHAVEGFIERHQVLLLVSKRHLCILHLVRVGTRLGREHGTAC